LFTESAFDYGQTEQFVVSFPRQSHLQLVRTR